MWEKPNLFVLITTAITVAAIVITTILNLVYNGAYSELAAYVYLLAAINIASNLLIRELRNRENDE